SRPRRRPWPPHDRAAALDTSPCDIRRLPGRRAAAPACERGWRPIAHRAPIGRVACWARQASLNHSFLMQQSEMHDAVDLATKSTKNTRVRGRRLVLLVSFVAHEF